MSSIRRLFSPRSPYPYLALASVGLGWWGQIAFKGINSQKANAGITKAVLYHIRHDDGARALLGENIHHDERKHPSVKGDVNMMKGRADFDYVVEGSKSLGTVHYSGARNGTEWTSNAFTITTPSGQKLEYP